MGRYTRDAACCLLQAAQPLCRLKVQGFAASGLVLHSQQLAAVRLVLRSHQLAAGAAHRVALRVDAAGGGGGALEAHALGLAHAGVVDDAAGLARLAGDAGAGVGVLGGVAHAGGLVVLQEGAWVRGELVERQGWMCLD